MGSLYKRSASSLRVSRHLGISLLLIHNFNRYNVHFRISPIALFWLDVLKNTEKIAKEKHCFLGTQGTTKRLVRPL